MKLKKQQLLKETVKGTSPHDLTLILSRHFDTTKRFLKDALPRKSRCNRSELNVATQRDLCRIQSQLCLNRIF